jgi:hypothetical protein
MDIPEQYRAEVERFPAVLLALLAAELAAGNGIAELGHGFPAAPCGAYVLLKAPVTTRPRAQDAEIDFYDYNTRTHSGRFSDAKKHFFILEPPHGPGLTFPPEPMTPSDGELAGRFHESMAVDYDKWHDGIGYDLAAIRDANEDELEAIERMVLANSPRGWRDVEAMAVLNTPRMIRELRAILKGGDNQLKQAVDRYAPDLMTKQSRTATLVRALEESVIYGGLTQALDDLPDFHRPEAVEALFRGALRREGEVAVHFAAMLYYLHGKAKEPFDWGHRPFYLRFHAPVGPEREAVFRELCATIGVDAERYLGE